MKFLTTTTLFFVAATASAIPPNVERRADTPTMVKRADDPRFTWTSKPWADCILGADIPRIAKEYRPILQEPNVRSLFYTGGTEDQTQRFKDQRRATEPSTRYITLQDVWATVQSRRGTYGSTWWFRCYLPGLFKKDYKWQEIEKAYNEVCSAAFASVSKGPVSLIVPNVWEPYKNGPNNPRGIWVRAEFPSLDRRHVPSIRGYRVDPTFPGGFRPFNIHPFGDGQSSTPRV